MDRFWEYLTIGAYIALVYVLVRPGSQGPVLVNNFLGGLTKLIGAETGGGGW